MVSLTMASSSYSTSRRRQPLSPHRNGHSRATHSLDWNIDEMDETETNGRLSKTSRIMSSVRRTLSLGSHKVASPWDNTVFESTPSRHLRYDASIPPPTIEQISIGLDLSRTPYLRSSPHTYSSRAYESEQHLPVSKPPPPPSRFLFRKASSNSSATPDVGPTPSGSSTAVNSNSNYSASLTRSTSLKTRVSRFLQHAAPSSPLPTSKTTKSSLRNSSSDSNTSLPRKKAVRFSTPVTKGE
ncbi:hypothetical protein D9758_007805 [Tetrapyrgos nigripes]|uniref:Uncharacterized protein n=1 Tax=Tetrapyrgos nigripes TaxID=182062 RepID=A0A8H5FV97_9AGAR|nr:hypothetical protein D9758_007805 [Tetrapyrgos nigripes]